MVAAWMNSKARFLAHSQAGPSVAGKPYKTPRSGHTPTSGKSVPIHDYKRFLKPHEFSELSDADLLKELREMGYRIEVDELKVVHEVPPLLDDKAA
jgi:hypothetical protein